MKQGAPLKRTPFKRKEPTGDRLEHPRAKEASPDRDRTCKHCGRPFPVNPRHPLIGHCSYRCGVALHKAREEAAKKAEKAQWTARKEAIKSVSEWEEECRRIVQKIARIRDRNDGCISCHLPASWDGQWHGSHFRSHGACSSLQFHLWNIHKSCSSCNRDKGGNIHAYRPRLIAKISQDHVDWLMAQPKVGWKHGPAYVEYLKRFKKVMGKRLRRMEKRDAMQD